MRREILGKCEPLSFEGMKNVGKCTTIHIKVGGRCQGLGLGPFMGWCPGPKQHPGTSNAPFETVHRHKDIAWVKGGWIPHYVDQVT